MLRTVRLLSGRKAARRRSSAYRLFFNPNIHPYKEFRRRLNTAEEFAQKVNLPLIVDNKYQLREFLQKALTIEKHTDGLNLDNRRCRMCYAWRLHEAALYAKEHDFDAFTSTLFVSPYQNHQMMKDVAEKSHVPSTFLFIMKISAPATNAAWISVWSWNCTANRTAAAFSAKRSATAIPSKRNGAKIKGTA